MCPFLEDADPRCACHLSLNALEEALGLCADRFDECPAYRQKLLCDAPRTAHDLEPVGAAD